MPSPRPAPDLVARLRAAGCVFAEDEAALLSGAASGAALEALVVRRVAGEPLEYLLGWVEFCGHRYALSEGVFIPRQRSALLVEEAVRLGRSGGVIVDLCCGSGALGLAANRALDGQLYAVDIDPVAVSCARSNGVPGALAGDLFAPLPDALHGRVDLLLCNAPYVPTGAIAEMPAESRDHEPHFTVDGGTDGMDLQRRVIASAPDWLTPGGHLLTETSRHQAAVLAEEVRGVELQPRIVTDDERGATVVVGRRPAHVIAMAAFRYDGQVLLGHRHPTRRWFPDCWDLVGGHVEPGESPAEALVRECQEELGVTPVGLQHLDADFNGPEVIAHIYLVDDWTGEITNAAPDEHDALGWFTAGDLETLHLADDRLPALVRSVLRS